MLKRCEKYYRVCAPGEGMAIGDFMGHYPISLSFRTSEEVEAGDMLYTNLRYAAYAEKSRAPAGGYKRGMTLTDSTDGGVYRILTACTAGRLWILKLERAITDGEGGECRG